MLLVSVLVLASVAVLASIAILVSVTVLVFVAVHSVLWLLISLGGVVANYK